MFFHRILLDCADLFERYKQNAPFELIKHLVHRASVTEQKIKDSAEILKVLQKAATQSFDVTNIQELLKFLTNKTIEIRGVLKKENVLPARFDGYLLTSRTVIAGALLLYEESNLKSANEEQIVNNPRFIVEDELLYFIMITYMQTWLEEAPKSASSNFKRRLGIAGSDTHALEKERQRAFELMSALDVSLKKINPEEDLYHYTVHEFVMNSLKEIVRQEGVTELAKVLDEVRSKIVKLKNHENIIQKISIEMRKKFENIQNKMRQLFSRIGSNDEEGQHEEKKVSEQKQNDTVTTVALPETSTPVPVQSSNTVATETAPKTLTWSHVAAGIDKTTTKSAASTSIKAAMTNTTTSTTPAILAQMKKKVVKK